MSRKPTYLPTLWDLLLAHMVQWYKEPWFINTFGCLSCLVNGATTIFPVSTGNRTSAACMGDICLNLQTTLFPTIRTQC